MVIPIVLAAGLSRRMGSVNKLLLPFGDSTIFGTTLGNILRGGFERVVVVIGHESEAVKRVILDIFGQLTNSQTKADNSPYPILDIVENTDFEMGMTSSIKAGIRTLNPNLLTFPTSQSSTTIIQPTYHYLICLSDMPYLTHKDYQFLASEFINQVAINPKTIAQPIYQNKRGNPTLLAHTHTQDILNLEFTEGCRPIVQANAAHLKFIEMPTDACLRDIDTPEEFLRMGY
jgi:molybdenum cofactor cytidylyltransferase